MNLDLPVWTGGIVARFLAISLLTKPLQDSFLHFFCHFFASLFLKCNYWNKWKNQQNDQIIFKTDWPPMQARQCDLSLMWQTDPLRQGRIPNTKMDRLDMHKYRSRILNEPFWYINYWTTLFGLHWGIFTGSSVHKLAKLTTWLTSKPPNGRIDNYFKFYMKGCHIKISQSHQGMKWIVL